MIFGHKPEVAATVVGRDPPTDVAVIRVEEQACPTFPGDLTLFAWATAGPDRQSVGLSHTVSAGSAGQGRTNQT